MFHINEKSLCNQRNKSVKNTKKAIKENLFRNKYPYTLYSKSKKYWGRANFQTF